MATLQTPVLPNHSQMADVTLAKHIPELDGLRGIAVLMVIAGHGTHHTLVAVTGVSLFFVLSGFLITRILLHNVGQRHYFTNFYLRRALRIWPLYYLILAIAFMTPLFAFPHAAMPAWRYLLYIQNFWNMSSQPPVLGPTWSLAIEEQFYLAWPFIVFICRSAKQTAAAALLLILVTPLVRVLYHLHGVDPYAMTFGRLDGLATGAALAAVSLLSPSRRGKGLVCVSCILLSLIMLPLLHDILLRKALKDTSTNLLFAAVIGFAFYWRNANVSWLLRTPVLQYFGTISYCAYLVHLPLIYRFGFPVAFCLTTIIASASFFFFERPILQFKNRLTHTDSASSLMTDQRVTASKC